MSNNFTSIWKILELTEISPETLQTKIIEERFINQRYTGQQIATTLNEISEKFNNEKNAPITVSVTRAKEWRQAGFPLQTDDENPETGND